MANILITTQRSMFKYIEPICLTAFKDDKGNVVRAMPVINGDIVSWTVPDSVKNREIFKKSYEHSGYTAKIIDVLKQVPFGPEEQPKEQPENAISTDTTDKSEETANKAKSKKSKRTTDKSEETANKAKSKKSKRTTDKSEETANK